MKKINFILSIFVLAIVLVGCEAETPGVDSESPVGTENYPTPTFALSEGVLTSNEKDEVVIVYDVVMDKPINKPIDFTWVVLNSSTATEGEDFELVSGSVAAYTTTGQLKVKIFNDAVVEGTETLNLTIQSGPSLANIYLVNPNTTYPTVNIQIEDYEFCMWTLQVVDDYGDSWQGGKVVLTQDGVEIVYPDSSWDSAEATYEILIDKGAAYSFEYISGTTGTDPNQPGAPAYEEENSYTLTGPDGTVYTGGVSPGDGATTPDVGVIASGTSSCD